MSTSSPPNAARPPTRAGADAAEAQRAQPLTARVGANGAPRREVTSLAAELDRRRGATLRLPPDDVTGSRDSWRESGKPQPATVALVPALICLHGGMRCGTLDITTLVRYGRHGWCCAQAREAS